MTNTLRYLLNFTYLSFEIKIVYYYDINDQNKKKLENKKCINDLVEGF